MGGFFSALAGAGQEAGQVGQQLREHLESRRHDFASLLSQTAQSEGDPTTRAALLSHTSDLLAGKPIGQIMQKFTQTLQKRMADEEAWKTAHKALGQMAGQAAQRSAPPAPPPGPAQIGEVPGRVPQASNAPAPPSMTVGGMENGQAPQPSALPPAAMPSQSPVGPGASAPPMSERLGLPPGMTIPGMPSVPSWDSELEQMNNDLRWANAATRPGVQAMWQQRMSHNEALRQALETLQANRAYGLEGKRVIQSEHPNLPPWYDAALTGRAYGIQTPNMPFGAMVPKELPVVFSGQIPENERVDRYGQLIDPSRYPYVRPVVDMMSDRGFYYAPAPGPTQTVATENGLQRVSQDQPLPAGALPPGAAVPRRTGGINPSTGAPVFADPFQIRAGGNLGVSPSTLPLTTSRDQIIDLGDRKEVVRVSSQSRRGNVPVGPVPSGPAVPAMPARGTAAPARSATSGVPSAAGRSFAKALGPAQLLPYKNSILEGSKQLFGDANNPALKSLSSYARLADNPASRERIGTALKLVLQGGLGEAANAHAGASVGPVSISAGGAGEWFSNALGIPPAVAAQRAQILSEATGKLTPEEREYFNTLMNVIPTVTGFRKLTSGSAFKWAQDSLERELPMIGLAGVNSSKDFRQKMTSLGTLPMTAIENIRATNPDAFDPRMIELIRAGGRGEGGASAGPTSAPPGANIMRWTRDAKGNPIPVK